MDRITRLFDLTERVIEAIEQRDWATVLNDGAHLYGGAQSSGKRQLSEAAADAVDAALLMLEHPVFQQCCAPLARVMIAQLVDGWNT